MQVDQPKITSLGPIGPASRPETPPETPTAASVLSAQVPWVPAVADVLLQPIPATQLPLQDASQSALEQAVAPAAAASAKLPRHVVSAARLEAAAKARAAKAAALRLKRAAGKQGEHPSPGLLHRLLQKLQS